MTAVGHDVDIAELLATSGVEIDTTSRRLAEYSYDASNYRVAPRAVAFPRNARDVSRLVATCHRAGVPIVARGGGTSMAGNAIGRGVVLDMSRYMNAIVSIDAANRIAVVEPGVILADLAVAVQHRTGNRSTSPRTPPVRAAPPSEVRSATTPAATTPFATAAPATTWCPSMWLSPTEPDLPPPKPRCAQPIPTMKPSRPSWRADRRPQGPRRRLHGPVPSGTRPHSPAGVGVPPGESCCRRTASTSPARWSAAEGYVRRSWWVPTMRLVPTCRRRRCCSSWPTTTSWTPRVT